MGAGRGDFAVLLDRFHTTALDIYPYPEVDLVCDLTVSNPFRPESFEAVVLMNVLEHVYDTQAMLARLVRTIKTRWSFNRSPFPFWLSCIRTPWISCATPITRWNALHGEHG